MVTSTVLPLRLLNFMARKLNDDAVLEWTTSNEENIAAYEIERSYNGRQFARIGTVTPAGTGTSVHTYTFTDRDIRSAGSATLYYRLRIVEIGGPISYSDIKLVTLDPVVASLFPNPAKGFINAAIITPLAEKITYGLTDISGRVVRTGSTVISAGVNTLHINTADLLPGIYKLIIRGTSVKQTLSFVKQR
jgi:hypothetical protein